MRIALVVLNCLQRNGLELWYAVLHSIARRMRQNTVRLREIFVNLAKRYLAKYNIRFIVHTQYSYLVQDRKRISLDEPYVIFASDTAMSHI